MVSQEVIILTWHEMSVVVSVPCPIPGQCTGSLRYPAVDGGEDLHELPLNPPHTQHPLELLGEVSGSHFGHTTLDGFQEGIVDEHILILEYAIGAMKRDSRRYVYTVSEFPSYNYVV